MATKKKMLHIESSTIDTATLELLIEYSKNGNIQSSMCLAAGIDKSELKKELKFISYLIKSYSKKHGIELDEVEIEELLERKKIIKAVLQLS